MSYFQICSRNCKVSAGWTLAFFIMLSHYASADMGRIINGTEIAPHSKPWLLALNQGGIHRCAAVLLSNDVAATAATCIKGDVSDYTLVAGEHDNTKADGTEQTTNIKEVLVPGKRLGEKRAPLALLKVQPKFELNKNVAEANLPPKDYAIGEGFVTVVGWGATIPPGTNDASGSVVPLSVEMPLVPEERCNAIYANTSKFRVGPNEFCAGAVDGQGTCFRDAGGPAEFGDLVVGLVTMGHRKCNKTRPDIFLRFASYLDEIEEFFKIDCNCGKKAKVQFGIATNLMADICVQKVKYDETKKIQPPLKRDLCNPIRCAHLTWMKDGYACFKDDCPYRDSRG